MPASKAGCDPVIHAKAPAALLTRATASTVEKTKTVLYYFENGFDLRPPEVC